MQKSIDQISKKQKDLILNTLYKSTELADASGALRNFVEQMLTEAERITIGRRIVIARLILEGKTYNEINELLQISPNTYRDIRIWLFEQVPEYATVAANRKVQKTKLVSKSKKVDSLTLKGVTQKFPLHFLLFTIAKNTIEWQPSSTYHVW